MSKTYTVTLSDAEEKALSISVLSPEDWINHVVHEKCRVAMDEIVFKELQSNNQLTGTREEIVMQSSLSTAAEAALIEVTPGGV